MVGLLRMIGLSFAIRRLSIVAFHDTLFAFYPAFFISISESDSTFTMQNHNGQGGQSHQELLAAMFYLFIWLCLDNSIDIFSTVFQYFS
jgi:hypothetical protein